MEHHTTTSRMEAERFLGIAETLLRGKDLSGCRDFAILAQETEPLLEGSEQILAVSEVLLAADKQVNNHSDWYSILQVPTQRTHDFELIKKQYRRLCLLLHPDKNKLPFSDSAFRLVADAWVVVSDPVKKAVYDGEFARFTKVDLVAARKRKRNHKGADPLSGIDKLSDDILVAILSSMSFKEAARTSLLSRRWRYLWMFTSGTLEFEDMDSSTGSKIKWKKFKARVNRVLKLHQGPHVDSFIIRIRHAQPPCHSRNAHPRLHGVNNWIYFAMQKDVKRFDLDLQVRQRFYCEYEFPSIEKLLSRAHEVKPAFGSLMSLRLVYVDIKDEVVQFFLASCPYLEQLCIRASHVTKSLQVVDPLPNLRVMEISKCYHFQSLEVSAMNLISFTYDGNEISLPFTNIPNVSELTLGGGFCQSFMCEPNKHSSYSVHLVKLTLNVDMLYPRRTYSAPRDLPKLHTLKRLELNIVSQVGRSLLFFGSLVKASPFLHEFRIKISYVVNQPWYMIGRWLMFPEVGFAARFRHKNLKKFEVSGYIGCSSDKEFVLHLFKVAPSVEMVVVDTQSEYYEQELWDCSTMCNTEEGVLCFCQRDQMRLLEIGSGARTRVEAKERAKQLELSSPRETVLVIT